MARSATAARRSIAALGILLAIVLAGCSAAGNSGGGNVSANGKTLTIYAAAPGGGTDPAGQKDLLDAEQLAFDSSQAQVTAVKLRFVTLRSPKISDDARTAIQDTSTIAYIGEIAPGTSADSIGITNALDILQVSPTDTALELTQSSAAVAGSPDRYYEALSSYGHTFAREVPTTAQEARALVGFLGPASSVYVAQDGSDYGRALSAVFTRAAAGRLHLVSSPAGAGAVLLAMTDPARAAAVAAQNPHAETVAADALYSAGLAQRIPRVIAVTPGFLHPDPAFLAAFRARFGHVPDPRAVFGYEAIRAVLNTLAKAGSQANNRTTVVHDFFAIKNQGSALGRYSIDSNGDTSLAPFVLARVKRGVLTPFRALRP